jgi:hypothetical protein
MMQAKQLPSGLVVVGTPEKPKPTPEKKVFVECFRSIDFVNSIREIMMDRDCQLLGVIWVCPVTSFGFGTPEYQVTYKAYEKKSFSELC